LQTVGFVVEPKAEMGEGADNNPGDKKSVTDIKKKVNTTHLGERAASFTGHA